MNYGKTQAIIDRNINNLTAFELAEAISSGEIETSAFDNKPVFNCEQRYELWHKNLLRGDRFKDEQERYAVHQVAKAFTQHVQPVENFQMQVEGCEF